MKREYIQKNVYEAVQERFDFLFREFENIYVSFSGGKDSGLLCWILSALITHSGRSASFIRILRRNIQ